MFFKSFFFKAFCVTSNSATNAFHFLTDGRLSGGVDDDLRNAFANRYPAALESFQYPFSSDKKNCFISSKFPFSKLDDNLTYVVIPARTRSLYLCLADNK